MLKAKNDLRNLRKDELGDLFRELGLDDATVENNGPDTIIRSWILETDAVLDKKEYPGGATWENLKKALAKLGHKGIAMKI